MGETERGAGTIVIYFKPICGEEYPWGYVDALVDKVPAIQVTEPEFRYQAPICGGILCICNLSTRGWRWADL